MRDGDALLKLLILRFQLERMRDRGEITRSEFTEATEVISEQEWRLMDGLRVAAGSSPEIDKLFLDAVDGLRSELPRELVEKLVLSYSQEKARAKRLEREPEIPTEEEIPETPAEEEEEATVELGIPPPPIGPEIPGADFADEATAPVLEVEMEEEAPTAEREIEEHAGIARVFSAFLQERNIRWGEIVAALIMVGFAIPLSITIWQSTGRIGKYLIFLSTTLVLFGAGLYVFSRLKLAITGRVLLVITLLMIPLHFLALDMMQFQLLVSLPVLVALGAVGYLIARLIVVEKAMTFAVAYMIVCALHLAVRGFSSIISTSGFALVGAAWVSLAVGFWLLNQPQRKKEVINQKDADRTYLSLGVLSYAFMLLFIRTISGFSPEITFTQFSPVLFLFAVPSLCCGHQFLTKETSDECNARTGGTIITIGAYLVTIVSLIVAASNPTALLITSILATGVYIFLLGLCRRIFVLYLAMVASGVAYVSAGCILVGAATGEAFSWHPLDLASTAAALAPLSLIYLAAGYSLKRKKLNDLAPHIHYAGLALSGVLMLCSLADIGIGRYVLLLYAAVLAILTFPWRQRVFAYGACIVLAGSVFCFSMSFSPVVGREILANHALLGAFIASVYFLTGYFASRFRGGQEGRLASFHDLYALPLIHSSMLLTAVGAVMAVAAGPEWVSLICGGVIILNLLAYTLIYRHDFFVYAGCASALVLIVSLCYRLDFMPHAAFVVGAYAYALMGLGYYLLKRLQETGLEGVYAYSLVNGTLAVSILPILSLFYFYDAERFFSSAAIAILGSVFYLFALKIYPRKLWVYPFQILMTVGIVSIAWGLPDLLNANGGTSFYASSIVAFTLANLWIILGLTIRKWKEAICSRLSLPAKDYDMPFFHWTKVMVSLGFFVFMFLLFLGVLEADTALEATGLICQVLIASSLFLFLYRRFQRYQTVLLYLCGLLILWWASVLALPGSAFVSCLILTTALYAGLWYVLIRLRPRVRDTLGKIKLTFLEEERGRLLKIVNILMYCNTGLALVFAFIRMTSIPGIVAIFMMAAVYLLSAFDRERKKWGYLTIMISSLGCYAILLALPPIRTYSWAIVIPLGLLSLALAYLWEILAVWMYKRREGTDFFSEPCKWMGIFFTAVAFIITFLFVPNISPEGATAFQVSVGLLVFAGLTVFYLWIAWAFRAEVFVYIGEVALAGMIMFLRFTMPHWFENVILSRFWPVLVVGVSFAVVGLSYVLQKLRLSLYVRPSYYTAIFLPLIPLIGAWFIGMEISIHTLFGVSFFYFLVSYIRRERRYGYIAVAVFNIALQVLFVWQGIRLGVHPLIFVTPVGITLIGIAHLNRNKMDKKAVRLIRSFASAIIYAASTLELYTFETWVSPVVLAGLCVLGILAGIALRIRPFLYLGTAFLLVDILVQIYRAGHANTWIWWISGVAFGLIILVLFAWFERKRERVLMLLRSLKDWD